ncbi:unnamed protein product [Cochlearia groenlandica]
MAELHIRQLLDIKFRLTDGSDIGPTPFPDSTSVSSLKETVISHWPPDKDNGPKTVKEVKLISAGKVLDNNNKTVKDYRSSVSNLVGSVTTMHVIIQPPLPDKEKKTKGDPKMNKCVCSIM